MSSRSESRILPYAADFIYRIVADVERYPEFVPWCAGLRVLRREPAPFGEVIWAETLVGYRSLRERYTSRVELDPANGRIDVKQTEGPFRQLENHWRITPAGAGCRVDFSILFEFRSRMLGHVAGAALALVMGRMTDAFEARARALSEEPQQ
ncbi:MAG TPA: type II toxin-antitoxin system RatA family toxin [Rhizomicrobium sp.]|nr:type II toxin-antitoxin system RatA family toxin [Rhizomicrobium sp.]